MDEKITARRGELMIFIPGSVDPTARRLKFEMRVIGAN